MGRHETRWKELRCEVWRVQCDVWRKVLASRCIAPGTRAGHVLGQQHCNSFAQSTHARAWLAHCACKFLCSSTGKWVMKAYMTYEKRWDEKSSAAIRWEELRWDEGCSVKCAWGKKSAVWSVECEVWSVDCEVWRFECEECSVKCGLWSAQCEVWSVECEECSVKCEVWRVWSVKSEECSVKSAVWSV